VAWNETDVHVLIAQGLGEEIAQVLKVGGLRGRRKWRVASDEQESDEESEKEGLTTESAELPGRERGCGVAVGGQGGLDEEVGRAGIALEQTTVSRTDEI